jgi:hypothetical protein
MSDDLHIAIRRRRSATADAHQAENDEATSRNSFLTRAYDMVERLAEDVDDLQIKEALSKDTDAAVLTALGLMRAPRVSMVAAATDPLAAARARGEQAKRDLLAMQGDMLVAAEVAARLGLSLSEIEKRRRSGLLLALPDDQGRFGFPEWQFTANGLVPGLEEALSDIGVNSPWSQAAFFFSGDIRLDWHTPLEVLLRGDIDAVRRAAAAYGEQVPA